MLPSLLTERLTLRALRLGDLSALVAACRDPEIVRWCVSIPLGYTEQDALDFISYSHDAALAEAEFIWAIDASGVFAGVVSLFDVSRSSAEVGFWLAPDSRGQGFMAEALGAVTGFALDPLGLGLDRLVWTALQGNSSSEKVARKVGFEGFRTLPEGTPGRPGFDGVALMQTARQAELTRQRWAEVGFPG
ncbi:GNAT family N-acetyltransferase [Rothia sp. CCM 9417]|uniref:GNAT family N-acetyltransferase n=1 Tax=unclassified Rothia (in: high G+C Gram-positive bacteria) TaxID=2689056 RepID=UPI003AC6E807